MDDIIGKPVADSVQGKPEQLRDMSELKPCLHELPISDKDKEALARTIKGITAAQLAFYMGWSYTHALNKLNIWAAGGWVRKYRDASNKVFFRLNTEEVRP